MSAPAIFGTGKIREFGFWFSFWHPFMYVMPLYICCSLHAFWLFIILQVPKLFIFIITVTVLMIYVFRI
jgi:hypothetical protein